MSAPATSLAPGNPLARLGAVCHARGPRGVATRLEDLESWIADEGKLFHDSFSSSIDTVAGWMSHDLEAFAGKTEFSKTENSPASCFQN